MSTNGTVANAFTVDVENWCHATTDREFRSLPPGEQRDGVMRGLDVLLDLLDRGRCRGTFFVLGSVAEAVPDIPRTLRAAGHEIGSHGYDHRRVNELTPEEFAADLRRSRAILGDAVTAYRSPMWSLYAAKDWALDVLVREGFRTDSSLFPIRRVGHPALPKRPYDIRTPSGVLTEIPPLSTRGLWTRYPVGGTWGLRTFGYGRITRAVERANREGLPAVFHLHPWELDRERPKLRQPFWTRMALTLRFTDLRKRLGRLLDEFHFATLSEAAGTDRPELTVSELP